MSDLEKSSGVTEGHQVDVRVGAFRNKDSGDTSGFGGLVAPVVMPGASSKPFGAWFDMATDVLETSLTKSGIKAKDAIEYYTVDRGEFTIHAKPEHLLSLCQYLRDDEKLRFEMCASVSGVHFPNDKDRELVAVIHLLSMTHNRRIRVQVAVADSNPHLPSITALWPNADWHERETYDFFGIIFDGHPALTRIQMPDDWPGHPQRKDYPLGGIPVEYKGAVVPPPSERRGY